jgi:hypothetical protein
MAAVRVAAVTALEVIRGGEDEELAIHVEVLGRKLGWRGCGLGRLGHL